MKKVIIISPYFPPSNAADMQRVRTSLPYFEKFGWKPEIVCVDDTYSDMDKDSLLLKSIPNYIKIHKVKALSKKITVKFGLGSIALRSMFFYRIYINRLLKSEKFDLIYFSTTQFPVCVLGNYWKKKFNIPYVIDLQDPWHTEYYKNKPKSERPKKYWFSYYLNKYLEPLAIKNVDGLISVSEKYIKTLKEKYYEIISIPFEIIPFGSHKMDFKIAEENILNLDYPLQNFKVNFVYTGAVGHIMKESISFLCRTLLHLKRNNNSIYKKIHFHFIGTSYAPMDQGQHTVSPIAKKYGVDDIITEQPNRISYYKSLLILKKANELLILGSDDISYNPSKILTYALAEKPVIGIFKSESIATQNIQKFCNGKIIKYENKSAQVDLEDYIISALENVRSNVFNSNDFNPAEEFTKQQCNLFDQVVSLYTKLSKND